MASFSDLSAKLRARAVLVRTASSGIAVKVADAIIKDLIQVTPVDTSNALSNWQIGIGAPVQAEIGPYVPGHLGSTKEPSREAAYAVAQAKLAMHQPGQTIYISNLADYIVHLDNGSSWQAPAGFVARAMLIGRKIASESSISVNRAYDTKPGF